MLFLFFILVVAGGTAMVEQCQGRRFDGVGVRVPGGHERDQQRRL